MTLKEHMERIALASVTRETAKPMTYRNGTLATNGRMLVWVPLAWAEYQPATQKIQATLDDYFLANAPTLAVKQSAELLRAWAGPVVWSEPCPECKGLSKASEHVYCGFCDNDGECLPDARRGYLCNAPVDRNYVAMVLEHWTESVTVRWFGGSRTPLYLVGETWLGAIMPMSETKNEDGTDPWQDAPRLP